MGLWKNTQKVNVNSLQKLIQMVAYTTDAAKTVHGFRLQLLAISSVEMDESVSKCMPEK